MAKLGKVLSILLTLILVFSIVAYGTELTLKKEIGDYEDYPTYKGYLEKGDLKGFLLCFFEQWRLLEEIRKEKNKLEKDKNKQNEWKSKDYKDKTKLMISYFAYNNELIKIRHALETGKKYYASFNPEAINILTNKTLWELEDEREKLEDEIVMLIKEKNIKPDATRQVFEKREEYEFGDIIIEIWGEQNTEHIFWIKKESPHFIFHYQIDRYLEVDHEVNELENLFEDVLSYLEVPYNERNLKISYYWYSNWNSLEYPCAGVDRGINVVNPNSKYHEFGHVAFEIWTHGKDRKGKPNRFISEGFAEFINSKFNPEYSQRIETELPLKDVIITLNSLDSLPSKGSIIQKKASIAYREAGSFIRFLIEEYGLEKFKYGVTNFYWSKDYESTKTNFEKIYNKSLDELEKEWKEWLKAEK